VPWFAKVSEIRKADSGSTKIVFHTFFVLLYNYMVPRRVIIKRLKMKKLFSAILLLLASTASIGQTVEYTDLSTANEAKLNGVFHFNFDAHFTADALDKASAFYTKQFKVDYVKTSTGHSATITILTDDNLSRKILERYFATLGVQKINVDGAELDMRPFLFKFVMLPKE